jgi:Family of unknown function (DUF6502)
MGNFPIYNPPMTTESAPTEASTQAEVLAQALAIMEPLAAWLVRSGVGHAELAQALKPVFLDAAAAELGQHGRSATDSALSVLSGLHRKDVKALGAAAAASTVKATKPSSKISPASTLATRWIARGLPLALPYASTAAAQASSANTTTDSAAQNTSSASTEPPNESFESLARSVSNDIHPRTLLLELLRLGVASEAAGVVTLNHAAFVPNPQLAEARELLGGSVADHLAAGVHNLTAPAAHKRYLDQSVFADGLSVASTAKLQALATSLWQPVLQAMVQAAQPLCDQDAAESSNADSAAPNKAAGDQRIRLGMFCYAAPMNAQANAHTDTQQAAQTAPDHTATGG